jgi:hypothetical protein
MLVGELASRGGRVVLSDDTGRIGLALPDRWLATNGRLSAYCGSDVIGMTDLVLLQDCSLVLPSSSARR